RDHPDLERLHHGRLDPRRRVPVDPVVEGEALPDVAEAPARRGERAEDHEPDRQQQVAEREECVRRQQVTPDPAHHPVSLSVPTMRAYTSSPATIQATTRNA